MAANATPTLRHRRLLISANVLVQIIAVLVLMVMVNWLVCRHYTRFDWTKSGYYKISDKTKQVLQRLQKPIRIVVYLQPTAEREYQEKLYQDVRNLLKEFQFFGKDKLSIEYVDPYRDVARARQIVEEYKFDVREPALVIFANGPRHKYVGMNDMVEFDMEAYGQVSRIRAFKAEGTFLSAIQTVTEEQSPTIYFLAGHGERDPESFDPRSGYSTLATYIKRDNITVAKWNLLEQQTLPTNAAAIVIAGPKNNFNEIEINALDQHLKNKGRLLMMLDPHERSGLETFLQRWGVQVDDDLALRKAGSLLGTELLDVNAVAAEYAPHPITRKLQEQDINTEFPYARSIRGRERSRSGTDQPRVTELLKTSSAYWGETNPDTERAAFDPATDIAGPLPLAVAVEAGKPRGANVDIGVTRMVVVGTSSFADNSGLTGGNLDFFMNALNWLLQREQLIAVGPKVPEEFHLDMSVQQVRAVYTFVIVGLPLAVAISGLFVWTRRRK
jgi:ABC-type uncharacterized transport system involved in gliding motility auxiliary subunit